MMHKRWVTQMWDRIWPALRSDTTGRLTVWRERILTIILGSLVLLGLFPLVTTARYAAANEHVSSILLMGVIYVSYLVMLILRRPRFAARVWITAASLYGLALMSFSAIGPLGSYRIWLFALSVIVGMLLGLRSGLVALALSLGTAGALAALVIAGPPRWPISEAAVADTLVMTTVTFGSLSAAVTLSLAALVRSLESALHDQEVAVRELGKANLELRREVDRRHAAERALRESEARYRSYVDHAPTGILISDTQGRLLEVNPAATAITGYARDDLLGMAITDLFPEGDGRPDALLGAAGSAGAPRHVEIALRRKDGDLGFASCATVGLSAERRMTFVADITKRKRAERELAQQERLAAVGQLAAGIAHDFNNILAVIMLYAQMDLANPALPGPFRSHMETIAREGRHAANLVEQILDFGRRGGLDPSPMDLVPFMEAQVRLLARTLPESIAIELKSTLPRAVVKADPTRMRQVITNLAVNARDAMPDGGTLSFTLTRVMLDAEAALPLPDLAPGAWVKLTVRDTGTGMSPEVRRHLFEPFYTTKEPGAGTGLGLAQVYGIVKQHAGAIGVETEPGVGTAFDIYLPEAGDAHPDPVDDAGEAARGGQGETVLVVEDDELLRQALVSTLEMLGYRSREAANGDAALALLAGEAGAEIDVVLSDLVMPELGGHALFQTMRKRGYDHPVVIISGHLSESERKALEAAGVAGWLMKPVQVDALGELLARALRNRS
jgi:two-component system, cell cycle sensor histidine kinase and response regulator CckA